MTAITHTYRFSGYGEDFGPRHDGLVILHTTESVAQRNTVADGLVVAKWQDRDDVIGSYNRLVGTDGVLSCVPDDHASGGVATGSEWFKPVSWLYQLLEAHKVNDPNLYALQLSAIGQRAWFDANGWPDGIIDGFARSIIDEEERIGRGVVVANHANFQPGNRSDAGSVAMNLTMKRYNELMATPKATFVDVSPTSPFFADVEWLAATGITGGIGGGKFGPKDTVTREQMAAFLRGLLESMAFLVLYAVGDAVVALPNLDPMWVMLAGTGIRFGEGVIDKVDPAKQRQRDAIRKDPEAPSTG